VAKGFFAFQAKNPAEMVRYSQVIDVVQNEISLSIGLSPNYVNVVMGSGPLDGDEEGIVSSLFAVPKSQAFYSFGEKTQQCKVFAVYSIQEPAPKVTETIATPAPPVIDEPDVVARLKHLNVEKLEERLTQDLSFVDPAIGDIEVMEESVCEHSTGKCTHKVVKHDTAA